MLPKCSKKLLKMINMNTTNLNLPLLTVKRKTLTTRTKSTHMDFLINERVLVKRITPKFVQKSGTVFKFHSHRVERIKYYSKIELLLHVAEHDFRKDSDCLVGVETNPGPYNFCSCKDCINNSIGDVRLFAVIFSERFSDKYLPFIDEMILEAHGHRIEVLKEIKHLIVNKPQMNWDLLGTKELGQSIKEASEKIDLLAKTAIIPEMEQMTAEIANLPFKVDHLMQPHLDKFANFSDNIKDIMEKGVSVNHSFDNFFSLLKNSQTALIAVSLSYIILEILDNVLADSVPIKVMKYMIAIGSLAYVGTTKLGPLLMEWLKPKPQADFSDWISIAIEGISLVLFGFKLKTDSVSDLLSSLRSIQLDYKSVEDLCTRVVEWFKKLAQAACETFGLELGDWFFPKDNRLKQLQVKCNALMEEYLADPMQAGIHFSQKVTKLMMEVNEFSHKTPNTSSNAPILSVVRTLNDKIFRLQMLIGDKGINVGDRCEAGLITMAGAPGVGKTYLSAFLSQHIAIKLADKSQLVDVARDWKSQVYIWPLDGKHHDQYMGQQVIVFPDLFCQSDMPGTQSEAVYMIYLLGDQALNMLAAEITKKQRLWMISSAIVACTNTVYVCPGNFPSLNNIDALIRRLNECGWYIWVNPKYAKLNSSGVPDIDPNTKKVRGHENDLFYYAMIDKIKIAKAIEENGGKSPNDAWFVRKHDFGRGCFADNKIYNIKAYFDLCIEYVRSKQDAHKVKKILLDTMASELVAERSAEFESISQVSNVECMVDESFVPFEELDPIDPISEMVKQDVTNMEKRLLRNAFSKKKPYKKNNFNFSKMSRKPQGLWDYKVDYRKVEFESSDDEYFDTFAVGEDTWRPRNLSIFKNITVDSSICYETHQAFRTIYADLSKDHMVNDSDIHFGLLLCRMLDLDRETMHVSKKLKYKQILFMCRNDYATVCKNYKGLIVESAIHNEPLAYMCRVAWDLTETCLHVIYNIENTFTKFYESPIGSFFCMGAAYTAGMMITVYGLSALFKMFLTPSNSKRKGRVMTQHKDIPLEPQSNWFDSDSDYKFIHKYYENFFMVYITVKDGDKTRIRHPCNLVFLGNKTAVVVEHFYQAIIKMKEIYPEQSPHIILVPFGGGDRNSSTYRYGLSDVSFEVDPDLQKKDLRVMTFRNIRNFPRIDFMIPPKECLDFIGDKKDLTGRFIKKATVDLEPTGLPTQVFVRMNLNRNVITYPCEMTLAVGSDNQEFFLNTVESEMWGIDGIHASFITEGGDCTSPCFLVDERKNFCTKMGWAQAQQPWLCYLHVSLHGLVPNGIPVYRELFQRHFDNMKNNIKPVVETIVNTFDMYKDAFVKEGFIEGQGGNLEFVEYSDKIDKFHNGVIALNKTFPVPFQSTIKRSRAFGLDPVTRYPARLKDFRNKNGELVQVMKIAREPYGSNQCIYNEKLMERIIRDTIARIMSDSSAPVKTEVLNFEQMIYGDAAYSLKGIDWNTSAGFMMRMMKDQFNTNWKAKRWMVSDDRLTEQAERIIKRLLVQCEEKLRNGERVPNVFIDNLKDELLKAEKVTLGKTRLFCSADFIFNLLTRKYFGAFAGWIFENRVRNGIAIGVNPYGDEWDAIFDHLNNNSAKVIFGDYGKFDKRQKRLLMLSCLWLAFLFYGGDNPENFIRASLFDEMMDSIHVTVINGKIVFYIWEHGNTSGNFLTAILNSIVNICIVHIAAIYCQILFLGIDPNREKFIAYDFDVVSDNTKYITLGDDLVLSVNDNRLPYVTFNSIKFVVENYLGMEFTDELKTGGVVPDYRGLFDGSFLGRKFFLSFYNGARKIKCPLRPFSVIEKVQWVKGLSDPEIEIAKFEDMNLELSEHPVDFFMSIVPRYAEACKKLYGRYPKYTNYDTAWERVVECSYYAYSFQTFFLGDDTEENTSYRLSKLVDRIKNATETKDNIIVGLNGLTPLSEEFSELKLSHGNDLFCSSKVTRKERVCQMDTNSVTDFEAASTTVHNSTTSFIEAAPVVMGTSSQPTLKTSTYIESLVDIKSFLSKPALIGNGTWTTSQVINTNLYTQSIANLLSTTAIWKDKVSGFNLMKGDFLLKIQLNASPFQQGKLILHYLPCAKNFAVVDTQFLNKYNRYLTSKVQHPHVELDCRKTSILLRIPYVAPTAYFSFAEGYYDWGTVFLDVFSPLLTGATATPNQKAVDYSIYGYWENVELVAPIIPQMGNKEKVRRRGGEEEVKENSGPIANGLRAVHTAADALSSIPLLTEFTAPVAWAANIGANVASTFGWSKPRELEGTTIVSNQLNRYAGTYDGPDLSIPGGLSCLNRLQTIDYGSFTNEDEMSTEYLYKVPYYGGEILWSSSNAQGTSLYQSNVNPIDVNSIAYTDVGAGVVSIKYTVLAPFQYMANFFNLWRGSLVLTLKIIKTQMHSGRLQVTFLPATKIVASQIPNLGNSSYALRSIVDIRTEEVVTFELPYLAYSDYLTTRSDSAGGVTEVGSITGLVNIVVLNELKAPDTCSDTIAIQYFWSAGKDYELAVPSYFNGGMPYSPQMSGEELIINSNDQGMELSSEPIGGISVVPDSLFHCTRCIGERFFSTKSLLQKNSSIQGYSMNGSEWTFGAIKQFMLRPWFTGTSYLPPATANTNGCWLGGDMYSQIIPMFAFFRGGMRVNIIDPTTDGTINIRYVTASVPYRADVPDNYPIFQALISNTQYHPDNKVGKLTNVYPGVSANTIDKEGLSFQHIPYYSALPFSLVLPYNSANDLSKDPSQPWSMLQVETPVTMGKSLVIQRSVADDFQAMFFIGCPPIVLASAGF